MKQQFKILMYISFNVLTLLYITSDLASNVQNISQFLQPKTNKRFRLCRCSFSVFSFEVGFFFFWKFFKSVSQQDVQRIRLICSRQNLHSERYNYVVLLQCVSHDLQIIHILKRERGDIIIFIMISKFYIHVVDLPTCSRNFPYT